MSRTTENHNLSSTIRSVWVSAPDLRRRFFFRLIILGLIFGFLAYAGYFSIVTDPARAVTASERTAIQNLIATASSPIPSKTVIEENLRVISGPAATGASTCDLEMTATDILTMARAAKGSLFQDKSVEEVASVIDSRFILSKGLCEPAGKG